MRVLGPRAALLLALLSPCALSALCGAGCSAASPFLGAGRTTPDQRTDLGLGGAFRLPQMALEPTAADPPTAEATFARFVQPAGVLPVAWARRGLLPDLDLGLLVSPSTLRLDLRGQLGLDPQGLLHLILGIAPYGGGYLPLEGEDSSAGSAFRAGVEGSATLALELFSLYELWLGVRLGVERVGGELGPEGARLAGAGTAFRAGGAVGLAIGFRRVHLLLELAVDHELWMGSLGGEPIELSGIVLTPAFALRIRL